MTPTYVDGLIAKYAAKGVLVDTNVLLLHFIGSFDVEQIQRFKRTKQFTIRDFYLIEKFLGCFKETVTTPNILTEVSNLAGQLPVPEALKSRFWERFGNRLEILSEEYCPSVAACAHPYFNKCGLTDAVILQIAKKQLLVITDDFRLAGLISNRGLNVINFNHIRQSYLLSS
jgi:hypothetical protein